MLIKLVNYLAFTKERKQLLLCSTQMETTQTELCTIVAHVNYELSECHVGNTKAILQCSFDKPTCSC